MEESCRSSSSEEAHQAEAPVSTGQMEEQGDVAPHSPSRSGGTPADSDAGCSCCPNFVDAEARLTQRRPHAAISRKTVQPDRDADSIQLNRSTRILQERALLVAAILACSMLLFFLLPLENLSGISPGLGAMWTKLTLTVVPRGQAVWEFKWRYLGGPNPQPLYNTTELGAGAIWPHGSAEGFAAAMGSGHVQRVAVVGNGPVTEEQRRHIDSADRVIRFNAMNNRRAEERVDVWVVRYNRIPPYMFWGFQQLGDAEIQGVLQQAKAVLFLGGSMDHNLTAMHEAVENVIFWFPGMKQEQVQQINFNDYWEAYNSMFSRNGSSSLETAETMPSSGLLGLLAVLAAVGPEVEVDLYGFNWSLQSYQAHMMSQEEQIIRAVTKSHPRINIHPTACRGLYSCDAICDTGQYRLAVDDEHCKAQVRNAQLGGKARFVDLHSVNNLDWHPELREEAEAKLGVKRPPAKHKDELKAWMKHAKAALRDDSLIFSPAPAPSPSSVEKAAFQGRVGPRQLAAKHLRGAKRIMQLDH